MERAVDAIATFFLGGYQSPIGEEWILHLPVWAETLLHLAVFSAKFIAAVVVMVWIRWTLPRFRVDQVMRLCWLTLVPLCLIALVGIALTMLAAGATVAGPAYGRLAAMPHLALGPMGHLLAWLVPVVVALPVIVLARRRHGRMHPALRELTG